MKRNKLATICICILISAIHLRIAHQIYTYQSAWNFGFLLSPDDIRTLNPSYPAHLYISEMNSRSLLYTRLVRILQEFGYSKPYKLPASLIIFTMVSSLLKGVRLGKRLVFSFLSTYGPVGVLLYTLKFGRQSVDLILLITFLLMVRIVLQRDRSNYCSILICVFSFLMYINHYSVWPFFALVAAHLGFITGWNENKTIIRFIYYSSITILPLAIYFSPFVRIISQVPLIIRTLQNIILGADSPLDIEYAYTIENSIPAFKPEWMPEYQYVTYFSLIIVFILLWFYIASKTENSILDDLAGVDGMLLVSVSGALVIVSFIYVIIGFSTRSVALWPVVFPLFVKKLNYIFSSGSNWDPKLSIPSINGVFILLIVAMLCVSLVPMGTPEYYTDRPTMINSKQIASSEFGQYVEDETIYTSLAHTNHLLVGGIHEKIATPRAKRVNGNISIDRAGYLLYNPDSLQEGIIITTFNKEGGMQSFGSPIPETDRQQYSSVSVIYDNGGDIAAVNR